MSSVEFKVPSSRTKEENEQIIIDLEKLVSRYDFFLHTTLEAVNQTASWKDDRLASINDKMIIVYVKEELERTKKSIRPMFKGKFDEERVKGWIKIFKEKNIIVCD